MIFRVAARPAQRSSRPLCRRLRKDVSVHRCLSSKAGSQPSASSSEGYVDLEHKRKLVSLYHKSENFVTHQNLSAYVDNEFAKPRPGQQTREEMGKHELDRELHDRRSNAAKWIVPTPESNGNSRYSLYRTLRYSDSTDQVAKQHIKRLKAALYGVDEDSLKTSAEMVEKFRRTDSLDLFEEDDKDVSENGKS